MAGGAELRGADGVELDDDVEPARGGAGGVARAPRVVGDRPLERVIPGAPEVAAERQHLEGERPGRLGHGLARERQEVDRLEMLAVVAHELAGESALAIGAEAGAEQAERERRVRAVEANAGEARGERRADRVADAGALALGRQAGARSAAHAGDAPVGGAARLRRQRGAARGDVSERTVQETGGERLRGRRDERLRLEHGGRARGLLRQRAGREAIGSEGGLVLHVRRPPEGSTPCRAAHRTGRSGARRRRAYDAGRLAGNCQASEADAPSART